MIIVYTDQQLASDYATSIIIILESDAMNTITVMNKTTYIWANTGKPYDGNKANITAYLLEGIIKAVSANLTYNICAATLNHIDYTFISRMEVLQARNEASRLFPADYMLAKVDKLVRKHTAFDSMLDMMNAKGGYRPTLCTSRRHKYYAELRFIADYYDACMAQIGDDRRAYRI